jgi:hypothetical protein
MMNESNDIQSLVVTYVTYTPDGALDGCFTQVPGGDHLTRMIVVDAAISPVWVLYIANAARDGIELAPVAPAAPEARVVPQEVTIWQARAILIEDDLLDDVTAALAAIPDDKARKLAQAKFEYAATVKRDDALVTEIIPALGKSEADIDAMFVRAYALE